MKKWLPLFRETFASWQAHKAPTELLGGGSKSAMKSVESFTLRAVKDPHEIHAGRRAFPIAVQI